MIESGHDQSVIDSAISQSLGKLGQRQQFDQRLFGCTVLNRSNGLAILGNQHMASIRKQRRIGTDRHKAGESTHPIPGFFEELASARFGR